MELRHLRYFVTVVEEQSLTKVQKSFYCSTTFNTPNQKLEEELGIDLFEKALVR